MKYEITKNDTFKSVEISFEEKPIEAVREALKALRFRWHGVKKVWYGYKTEEEVKNAIETAMNGAVAKVTKTAKKVAEKVNEFGVKVGDIFYMSWGYDQTNVDFYQVTELVGKQSVKVVHVRPEILRTDNEGFMCATYTYNLTPELLPPTNGCHLKDWKNGDIKRVKKSGDSVYLNMASYANAYKVPFGEKTCYESWYA